MWLLQRIQAGVLRAGGWAADARARESSDSRSRWHGGISCMPGGPIPVVSSHLTSAGGDAPLAARAPVAASSPTELAGRSRRRPTRRQTCGELSRRTLYMLGIEPPPIIPCIFIANPMMSGSPMYFIIFAGLAEMSAKAAMILGFCIAKRSSGSLARACIMAGVMPGGMPARRRAIPVQLHNRY